MGRQVYVAWIKTGKRSVSAYFRRRVPADIREALRDKYPDGVVKRPLGVKDPREADRLARKVGVDVDEEFEAERRRLRAQEVADVPEAALEEIARGLYRENTAHYSASIDEPGFDPEGFEIGLDIEREDWCHALENNHWSDKHDAFVSSLLRDHGYILPDSSRAFSVARRLTARAILEANATALERSRGNYGFTPSDPITAPLATPQRQSVAPKASTNTLPLSELFPIYKAGKKPSAKTAAEFETAVRRFEEFCGKVPAGDITKANVREFAAALERFPRVLSGKLRKKTFPEVLKAVGDDPSIPRLSAGAVNKGLNGISAVLSWTAKRGYFDDAPGWSNPFVGIRVEDPEADRDKRLPYDKAELKLIFEQSPIYCTGDRPKAGSGEAAYWLPLLGLFAGARLEELGQALVSDVREEDGISYLDLNTIEEGKRLKNRGSKRKVPLHSELIRIGFLGYAAERRRKGDRRLFPELTANQFGELTHYWSKWWGRYARSRIGIARDRRKVFHSLRHNFKDACRRADISEEVHDAITGHTNGSVGRRYGGSDYPLEAKARAIAKVRYDLDLSGLYAKCGTADQTEAAE